MYWHNINLLAVLVAAVGAFLLGGLYYSHRFLGSIWARESGHNVENIKDMPTGHPAKVFGLSLIFALIASFCFAWVIGPAPDLMHALKYALLVGVGFSATTFGINYQFGNRSNTLLLIDAGYNILLFIVFAVVLGLWR